MSKRKNTEANTLSVSLCGKDMSLNGHSESGQEEVQQKEELLQPQEHSGILNAESAAEARQRLLVHQVRAPGQCFTA